jgi:hypothetical protein
MWLQLEAAKDQNDHFCRSHFDEKLTPSETVILGSRQ